MSERSTARRSASYLAVVAANLYPLVGVLLFDWNLRTTLVLYWVEMGVAACWGVPTALLAEPHDRALANYRLPLRRLREKRGGWTVRGLTLYPRNVPSALVQLTLLGVVWVAVGLFFATVLDLWGALGRAHWLTVGVGALGLCLAHGVEFARDYVRGREHEVVSARTAVAGTARRALFVLVLAVPVAAVGSLRAGGLLVVAAVVAAKLLAETYAHWVADGPTDGVLAALLGSRDTTVEAPAVPVPDGDPDAVRTPDARAVRVECLLRGLGALCSRAGLLCALATAFLAGFLRSPLALVPAALLVAGFCLGAAGRYLDVGTMSFRRYGDALVGHDRLLDEPQWRAPLGDCEASIPRRLTDRYADTALVRLDWSAPSEDYWPDAEYDPERTRAPVGPFDDFADAVAALDLPVSPAERPEPNWTVAFASLAFVALFATVPGFAWYASDDPAAVVVVSVLLLAVVGPFVVVAVYYL